MFGRELRKGAEADGDKDAVAELADRREGVGAVGGDADLGPGLLIGLWGRSDVFERIIFARIGEGVLGPRLLQDLQSLGEAFAAFAIGHAVGLVGAREPAAPDAEDQPPVADLIDGGGLLGEAQRMAQRQHLDAGADLHALGARGDRAGDGQRRGANRPFRGDVDLGQPHRVETPALGRIDLLERLGESRFLAHPRRALELVKHAELEPHRHFSLSDRAGTLGSIMRRCQRETALCAAMTGARCCGRSTAETAARSAKADRD